MKRFMALLLTLVLSFGLATCKNLQMKLTAKLVHK